MDVEIQYISGKSSFALTFIYYKEKKKHRQIIILMTVTNIAMLRHKRMLLKLRMFAEG